MPEKDTDCAIAARCESAARFLAIAVATLGLAVLAGWAFDIAALKSAGAGWASMKANTAMGFLLAGMALLCAGCRPGRPVLLRLRGWLAAAVTLLGLLTLGEHMSGADFGIDQLFFSAGPEPARHAAPGRMSVASAAGLALTGLALAALDSLRCAAVTLAAALASCLIGLLAILGHAYDVAALYGVDAYATVAPHTALGFVLINSGLLLARPRSRLMALVTGAGAGGVMARRLLPLALVAPFLIGWLHVEAEKRGWGSPSFGAALMALTDVILFAVLILWTAAVLARRDRGRRRLESALAGHAQALEQALKDSKLIEQQLRESEALFRSIFEHNMYAILLTTPDGDILAANAEAQRLFGCDEEALRRIGRQGVVDATDPRWPVALSQSEQTGVFSGELTLVARNGRKFPADVSSSMFSRKDGQSATSMIVRDITEQRRNQQALADSQRFMHSLIDIIPGMTGYWDSRLRCRFANGAYLEWFGKTAEQMRGIRIEELMGPDLFAQNEPYIRAALGGARQRFQRTLRKADGSIGYTWAFYIPDLVDGEVRGFFVLVSDITELKQSQLQLELLNKALRQRTAEAEAANAAKSAFLAAMSHEIRTPLNAVIGLAGLLSGSALERGQRDYADKIVLSAQALRMLVDDILDFSKIEAGALQLEQAPFSLNAILATMAAVLSVGLGDKPIEALFDIEPGIPDALIGDAMRVQQILLNLASNAIKFTERGEVVLAVRCLARSAASATLEFAMRDTGIGIAAEQMARIFEVFVQADMSTSRQYGGTGLGLAISARLAGLMGGRIGVDSDLGRGSVFRFNVTLAVAPCAPAARDAPSDLRVLIVDDHPLARDVLRRACAAFGWRASAFDSGPAGWAELRRAAAAGHAYDILLLDWRMPGMDGIEMLRQAAGTDTGLPRVILMAATSELERAAGAGAGLPLDGILAKPVTPASLLAAVRLARAGQFGAILPPSRPSGRRLDGLRLLVAEDNAINQEVIEQILRRAGAEALIVSSGLAAIEALETPGAHFDALLMDIQMPVMDGYTATRIIREEMGLLELPIIAVTAYAMSEDRERSRRAGMAGHIVKPIDVGDLLAILPRARPDARIVHPAAPALRQAPAPELDLPGVDTRAALAVFGEDREKYLSLLRQFVAGHAHDIDEAHRLFRAGNVKNAEKLVHGLHGMACFLHARELAALGARMTGALRQGAADSVPPLFDEFQAAMRALQKSIAGFDADEVA